eukprot:9361028-Pyramimonas_sp.AAC.1
MLRDNAPEPTQRVLVAGGPLRNAPLRNAPLVSSPDYAALGDYCIGLQLGWAQHVPGMLVRTVHP